MSAKTLLAMAAEIVTLATGPFTRSLMSRLSEDRLTIARRAIAPHMMTIKPKARPSFSLMVKRMVPVFIWDIEMSRPACAIR
jgi:uncharacterized membrane protein